jgi:hypothetical protein
MDLPKYKCQTTVRAAKIAWFGRLHEQYELHLDVNGEDVVHRVSAAWFERQQPAAGGYFVEVDGGLSHYVSAAEFERDYARALPPPPAPEPVAVVKPKTKKEG